MVLDRSMKTFFAVTALVAALFLMVNNAIDEKPIQDWGLAAILLVISIAFMVWLWQDRIAESRAIVVAEENAAAAQEWIISKDGDAQAARSAEAVKRAEATVRKELHRAATQTSEAVAVDETTKATEKPDDLERIEGIGPKYADALVEAGLGTFEAIAKATLEQLEAVIKAAGMRRSASMATWSEQAALAANNDWEGLDALQARLSGGRRK